MPSTLAASPQTIDTLAASVAEDEVSRAADLEARRLSETLGEGCNRVKDLSVEIDADPVAHGLGQFNEKLALVRQYANDTSSWLTLAVGEKARARQRRDNATAAFKERIAQTLAYDPDIADIPGQQAKMAAAEAKHEREARVVTHCERLLALATAYHDAIKLAHDRLKDTKGDLMAQLAVIKQQIHLGEVDPSKFPVERGGYGPPTSRLARAEAEVAAVLDGEGQASF